MATLAAQKPTLAGLNPSFQAAAGGGDQYPFGSNTFLVVKNGGGASINVTLNSVVACDQGSDHDQVVAVPNGGERWIKAPTRFADPSGYVGVTYSGVTSVTVAAIDAS